MSSCPVNDRILHFIDNSTFNDALQQRLFTFAPGRDSFVGLSSARPLVLDRPHEGNDHEDTRQGRKGGLRRNCVTCREAGIHVSDYTQNSNP